MTKAFHTNSATSVRQYDTLRSTLLLLLLCVTIVWPASLQSLFQSLDSDAFLISHTSLVEQSSAQGDSFAVAEYRWTPDPSDNQSALTKSTQIMSSSSLRPSDPNTRRISKNSSDDSGEFAGFDDATLDVSHANHSSSSTSMSGTHVFFADCALPTHAAAYAVVQTTSLHAMAQMPWQSPERLPSERGLVRFALAPPTSC